MTKVEDHYDALIPARQSIMHVERYSIPLSGGLQYLNHVWKIIPVLHLLLKKPGHFGVLDTSYLDLFARVLIPGDDKLIRVQFCCETFLLLRLLMTLKQTLTLSTLPFHDPFLLCNSFPLEH